MLDWFVKSCSVNELKVYQKSLLPIASRFWT